MGELSERAKAFSIAALLSEKKSVPTINADGPEPGPCSSPDTFLLSSPEPERDTSQSPPSPLYLGVPRNGFGGGGACPYSRRAAQIGRRRKLRGAFSECAGEAQSLSSVRCHLEMDDLWRKFHSLGTEMIITKSGRRMFPSIKVSFSGVDPNCRYALFMEIARVDDRRYRYAYHRSAWVVAGKSTQPSSTGPHLSNLYNHPDNPVAGHTLACQSVSFEKVKLTNSKAVRPDQLTLDSMHKYQPIIHLVKVEDASADLSDLLKLDSAEHKTFRFPETQFIGVTAYQNQLITQLKIDSNPFAKGFRDSTRVTGMDRAAVSRLLDSTGSHRLWQRVDQSHTPAGLGIEPTTGSLPHYKGVSPPQGRYTSTAPLSPWQSCLTPALMASVHPLHWTRLYGGGMAAESDRASLPCWLQHPLV